MIQRKDILLSIASFFSVFLLVFLILDSIVFSHLAFNSSNMEGVDIDEYYRSYHGYSSISETEKESIVFIGSSQTKEMVLTAIT